MVRQEKEDRAMYPSSISVSYLVLRSPEALALDPSEEK